MKYTAKEIQGNVNVSRVWPIRDFLELSLKVLGLFLAVYFLLGLAVNYLAPRISPEMEEKLGNLFMKTLPQQAYPEAEEQAQKTLNDLLQHASLPKFGYSVRVVDSSDINAIALPAGHIVVLTGLLEKVKSRNEFAMVLAHELGHFYYRDHLRGLGRGFVFLFLSSMLFGTDSSFSKFIAESLGQMEMKFSRTQERAADIYGLELVQRTYGNISGAVDFYEKMAQEDKILKFFYLFASHPYPQDRIRVLKELIRLKGYSTGENPELVFSEKLGVVSNGHKER